MAFERVQRVSTIVAIVLLALTARTSGEAGSPPARLTAHLVDPNCARAGGEVVVEALLRNLGHAKLIVGRSRAAEYEMDLVAPDGKPATLTTYGRREVSIEPRSFSTEKIGPKALLRTRILLSRFYDLSSAGSYRLTIARIIPRQDETSEQVRVTATITFVLHEPELTAPCCDRLRLACGCSSGGATAP
jgi:hypothetical protein